MTPPALRSWRSIILDDWRDDLRVVPKYVAQNMGAGQSPPLQAPHMFAMTLSPNSGHLIFLAPDESTGEKPAATTVRPGGKIVLDLLCRFGNLAAARILKGQETHGM